MINTHELKMTTANSTSREDITTALCSLAVNDEDFNGNNGNEYLWDVAKEKGFSSNVDYLVTTLPETNDVYQLMTYFFEHWLGQDCHYDSYEYDYTLLDNGKVVIAFSYVHED